MNNKSESEIKRDEILEKLRELEQKTLEILKKEEVQPTQLKYLKKNLSIVNYATVILENTKIDLVNVSPLTEILNYLNNINHYTINNVNIVNLTSSQNYFLDKIKNINFIIPSQNEEALNNLINKFEKSFEDTILKTSEYNKKLNDELNQYKESSNLKSMNIKKV